MDSYLVEVENTIAIFRLLKRGCIVTKPPCLNGMYLVQTRFSKTYLNRQKHITYVERVNHEQIHC